MNKDSFLKWIFLSAIFLMVQCSLNPFVYAEWTIVNPPDVSSNWALYGIRSSDSENWAVGQDFENGEGVLLSFSNGKWTKVTLPSVSSDWGLTAIALESSERWAVGQDNENREGVFLSSRNSWAAVQLPDVSSDWGLSSVDIISPESGWLVGQDFENKRGIIFLVRVVTVTQPVLTTTTVSNITDTTASSGGTITSDGGAPITARGVCWNTSADPVVGGNCTSDGTGTGIFTSSITGLTQNTTYHVRAYATNLVGTAYGSDLTFTTLSASTSTLPILATTAISNITDTTASSGGTITSDGGTPITARGVCWDTSANPAAGGNCTSDGTGTGTFTSFITGLTSNTTYHVRAYATNSAGTGYGSDLTFTTLLASTSTATALSEMTRTTPSDEVTGPVTGLAQKTVYRLKAYDLPIVSEDWGLSNVRRNWAVGSDRKNMKGVLLYFAQGAWISVNPPDVSSDWELSGLDLTSQNEGWAVGSDFENQRGVLLHLSKGSWNPETVPSISSNWGLKAVALISPDEGWAVGQDIENKKGVLIHFINGTWTPVELREDVGADWELSDVDLISSNKGWAVGDVSDGTNVSGVLLKYSVPRISLSSREINFGEVEVGTSSDKTVVVQNTGNGVLVIGTILPPSSPFVLAMDGCSGKNLAPSKTCKVTYSFAPDSEGAFSSNSNIPSNDANEDPAGATVTLSGTAASGTNYIDLQNPAEDQIVSVCQDYGAIPFEWDSSGRFKSIEVLFSSAEDFSVKPVRIKGNPDTPHLILGSSTWKKLFLLPGAEGGTIYWMVVGTKTDKTSVKSDVFPLVMQGPEAVANPEISSTSRSALSPPTLSWEDRCNTKFKVWFSNQADFQKTGGRKIAISYSSDNPSGNQETFTRELTPGQWSSIRKLGGDITGAVLYWRVESSDALGRKMSTEIMSFVLSD